MAGEEQVVVRLPQEPVVQEEMVAIPVVVEAGVVHLLMVSYREPEETVLMAMLVCGCSER